MKRLISVFLILTMLLTQTVTAFAVDESVSAEPDLFGEEFVDIQGDGSAYQIASIQPNESGDGFTVGYIAETETVLEVVATNDDIDEVLVYGIYPVPAGSGLVMVPADLATFPQYYRVEAALAAGGEIFTYYDHTREYEEFMAMGSTDSTFDGQVILDYGTGFDGTDNFAVVSEDVKVLYVESIDDVEIIGEEENPELFTLMDGADNDAYLFQDTLSDDVLSELESGDKLLILPIDDVNDAKTIVVGDVEKNASLFGDEGNDTVTVTPAETQPEMEEFFDYIRIHVEVEADTDDLDTTDADPGLIVEEIDPSSVPSAELMGSLNGSLTAKKTYTWKKSYSETYKQGDATLKSKLTISDTFTLKATVSLKIDYAFLKLKSVTATAKLNASNKFVIDANAKFTHSGEVYVGTIPVGTVSGITFKIPVYITHYVGLEGGFTFTATQSAETKVTATYKNGKYSVKTTKSAKCGKDLETQAKATVRLGIKGTVEAKLAIVELKAGVTGEVGIQVTGKMKKDTFNGELAVYVQPGFSIKWFDKKLVGKTWDRSTSRLSSIYFSKAVYYTMDELAGMTDDEIIANIALYEDEGIAVNINKKEDLQTLATYVNAGRPTAGLEFIINAQDSTWDFSGIAWIPIGNDTNAFQGTFDGRGTVFTGLTVADVDSNAGFFGALSDAVIHDVTLDNISVQGGSMVGGLAGCAEGSIIYDVSVSGTVKGTGGEIGGLVGQLYMSSLLNSYAIVSVSGTGAVGGLVGSFSYGPTVGQISNCYHAGHVTAEYECGAICGEVYADTSDDGVADDNARYQTPGISYCYYLADNDLDAAGYTEGDAIIKAWSVTTEQAQGSGTGTIIADDSFAAAVTLVDALNNWYTQYGAYVLEDEVLTETPDASVSDYYNHWYKDADETCTPYFEERAKTYPLTVYYVFEDGTEAFPSTTIYLALGQEFDVDAKHLDGYYTNVDGAEGYKGIMMPPEGEWEDGSLEEFYGIEFRIVYSKETNYTGSAANLSADAPAVSGSIYKISTEADLKGLAAYVAAGGNTLGVTFEQVTDIQLNEANISIGTNENPFRGVYIGNYTEIKGLAAPLFAATEGAEIRTLNLSGTITVSTENAGALISEAKDTKISECELNVAITNTSGNTGGLIASGENCTVTNSSVSGSVIGNNAAAGLIAEMKGGYLVNSQVSASIQGNSNVGALAGSMTNAVIENSFVSGTVSGTANVGGIAGAVSGGEISNCYCSGSVESAQTAGAAFGALDETTTVESIHYLNGISAQAVGNGSAEGITAFTEADIETLQEELNAWIAATTCTDYLTWTADLTGIEDAELSSQSKLYPVFGAPYESWITEFHISNGEVSFVFNSALTGGDTIYLAVYSEAGQMIGLHVITTDGQNSIQVGRNAAYAQCFSLDDEAMPLSSVVRTAK